jgi:hypothetical protein
MVCGFIEALKIVLWIIPFIPDIPEKNPIDIPIEALQIIDDLRLLLFFIEEEL